MLVYLLYGLFIISCIVLVASVLLQPGKADAGALFANTTSTTAFGARGTQTLLSKITIGAAAGFMLTALLLSLPGIRGAGSVINASEKAPPAPAATPAATPAAATTDANSNASASPNPASSPAAATTNANANSAVKATPAPAKSPAAKATPAPTKK